MQYTSTSSRLVFSAVLALALTILPFAASAAGSEAELLVAKDSLKQLSINVSTAADKRVALEQKLQKFDTKVAAAQKSLDQVMESKQFVRERISERQQLLAALSGQLLTIRSSQRFYQELKQGQQQTFVEFVRYVAMRDMVMTDTGPAAGDGMLRLLMRGSLGESIQDDMVVAAMLRTRMQILGQLQSLLDDSSNAEARLHAVAGDLEQELKDYELQQLVLGEVATKQQSTIDVSWKQRELTEQELAAVVRESDESNARLADIQSNLRSISDELKQSKLADLRSMRSSLEAKKRPLQENIEALKLKDVAMHIIEDNQLKAFQETVRLRNTDPKLYKTTQLRELQLKNAKDDLVGLEYAHSGSTIVSPDVTALKRDIAAKEEVLVLLRSGVPEEAALTYLQAKHAADQAKLERDTIAAKITEGNKQIADLTREISDIVAQIDGVQSESDGLPSLFRWPVRGPITAGYMDPAYETVFHIPHRAIDIGVPQGTAVHAVSDGIVYAVKDGGATGYSYILIGHEDGYASLYGHVSVAYVHAGQKVSGGAIIGLSGGTPGTHGAGHMTTGAHLHLEMTKNGKHFDARMILPKK